MLSSIHIEWRDELVEVRQAVDAVQSVIAAPISRHASRVNMSAIDLPFTVRDES
jgi:hypothetical protein